MNKLNREKLIEENRKGYIEFDDQAILDLYFLKEYIIPLYIVKGEKQIIENMTRLYCLNRQFERLDKQDATEDIPGYVAKVAWKNGYQSGEFNEATSIEFIKVSDFDFKTGRRK